MINFNKLNFRQKCEELDFARLLYPQEFYSVSFLNSKDIVFCGFSAFALEQARCLREKGLMCSFTLDDAGNGQFKNIIKLIEENEFSWGSLKKMLPGADFLYLISAWNDDNALLQKINSLLPEGACLCLDDAFPAVEEDWELRGDIALALLDIKSPDPFLADKDQDNSGSPALISLDDKHSSAEQTLEMLKAYIFALECHKNGVLLTTFSAAEKAALISHKSLFPAFFYYSSLLLDKKLAEDLYSTEESAYLMRFSWTALSQTIKEGGLFLMMDRLSAAHKIMAYNLCEEIKEYLSPFFLEQGDSVLDGVFGPSILKNPPENLKAWQSIKENCSFQDKTNKEYNESLLFSQAAIPAAFVLAGLELAYESLRRCGISQETAYFSTVLEMPKIAATIASGFQDDLNSSQRGLLIIESALGKLAGPLKAIIKQLDLSSFSDKISPAVNNETLIWINESINSHEIQEQEKIMRDYKLLSEFNDQNDKEK